MDLEGVFIENHGKKKILDSCVFSPDHELSCLLYECKEPADLPFDGIANCLKYLNTFSLPKMEAVMVYVIPECIKEKSRFLEHINARLIFLRKKYEDDEGLSLLNVLCKRTYNLIRNLEKRDLTTDFSEAERDSYEKLAWELFCLAEENNLKRDLSLERYHSPRSKHKQELNTDEKIIAAALTLAEREPVVIITRDHDVANISRYYFENIKIPKKRVNVFVDVGGGFKLYVSSYEFVRVGTQR